MVLKRGGARREKKKKSQNSALARTQLSLTQKSIYTLSPYSARQQERERETDLNQWLQNKEKYIQK